MSPRSRQLFALLAVMVFLILATFVSLEAAGRQWAGWRQGFVPSGVISIDSHPHAIVWLNGQEKGSTPRRFPGLRAGLYTIELRGPGGATWQRTISVQPGQAEVIGPVTLIPAHVTATPLPSSSGETFATDTADHIIFGLSRSNSQYLLAERWPDAGAIRLIVPEVPAAVAVSPHQQLLVLASAGQTKIVSLSTSATWVTAPLTGIFWLPGSDQVVYGLRAGQLLQLDSVNQVETVLGPAAQAGAIDQDLWRSVVEGQRTVILRQAAFSPQPAKVIYQQTGQLKVMSAPGRHLIVTDRQTLMTVIVDFPIAGSSRLTDLGPTDQVVWTEANQRPLWTHGVELWTLDRNGRPALLDRRSAGPNRLAWVESPHILITVDAQNVLIASVSNRQGRGILLAAPLHPDQTVLALSPTRRMAVVSDPTGLQAWSW